MARLRLELRASRTADSENELLDRIAGGGVPEHPADEDDLVARTIDSLREAVRAGLKTCMQGIRLP